MGRGLEHLSCDDRLRGLELEKRRLWGRPQSAFQDLKGPQESWRGTLYKSVKVMIGQGRMDMS